MAYTSTDLQTILDGLNGLSEASKMNVANLIFKETFKEKSLKDTHPYLTEIRSGAKMPILEGNDDFDSFPFTDGACQLPTCAITDNFSQFKWSFGEIGCEVAICLKDFTADFRAFFNTWLRSNEGEMEEALVQFIVERFQAKHLKAEIRVAYFGDASETTNDLINGFDGFFVQMEALAGAHNSVGVTENAGVSVAAQTITDGEVVYNYLKTMYEKASQLPWFDATKMVYRLDRTLVNTLVGWLNSLNDLKGMSCDCIDPTKVTQARVFSADNLTVFGIPVEPMPFIAAMKAVGDPYYDSVTGLFVGKNRFILTRKDNMLLAYETEETFNMFDMFWDRRKKETVVQGSSMFGVGVPTDSFILGI